VTVELTFKNYRPAEMLSYLPMFERPTSHSIRFTVRDMLAASRVVEFLGDYEIGLIP
jgi:D-aminopeptidase